MDTYNTDGTPVEINPVDRKGGGSLEPSAHGKVTDTITGSMPFHNGAGPGRGADKQTRRRAQDSVPH